MAVIYELSLGGICILGRAFKLSLMFVGLVHEHALEWSHLFVPSINLRCKKFHNIALKD